VIELQVFYEDLGSNEHVRGAYYLGDDSHKLLIDVMIIDPSDKVIYLKRSTDEGIFRFNSTVAGTYSFVFSNLRVRSIPLTLSIGCQEVQRHHSSYPHRWQEPRGGRVG
jgi:hypothetical protein